MLQNKKYIQFASKNTVEVIALGSLQRGIDAEDRKASTYTDKDDKGNEVEYMLEYPGLTRDQMFALARSEARKYNKTGKIPYTSIVDPHTLEEVEGMLGSRSAKQLMSKVQESLVMLKKRHGKGVSRADVQAIDAALADVDVQLEKTEFARAVKALDQAERKAKNLPDALRKKLEKARKTVLRSAENELNTLEALAKVNPAKVKKELSRIRSKFKGTGLEERLKEIMESVSG